jgi:hypothetical protein
MIINIIKIKINKIKFKLFNVFNNSSIDVCIDDVVIETVVIDDVVIDSVVIDND